jgi:hypothetical protein
MGHATAQKVLLSLLCFASNLGSGQNIGPAGKWAYEDKETYVGIELDGMETCLMVGAAKGHAGAGFHCRYELRGEVVRIVEVWDSSGMKQQLPVTYELVFNPAADTLTITENGQRLQLTRTEKLLHEQ